jgi:integrase
MAGHIRKRHRQSCAYRSDKARRCNCEAAWQARMPDPGGTGTKKVEKTFVRRRDAERWLTTQASALLDGTFIDPRKGQTPFRDVAEAWAASWPNRLSPTTVRRYRGLLDNYLLREFGAIPVGRIDRGVVQRWVNRLNADGLSAATVRGCCATLRACMNTAVRDGWIRANPAIRIDLPRAKRNEMLCLTADEVRAVAEGIDPHYRVLVYTAAYTGLRAGELLALRRKDVDLLRGTLSVERSLLDVNGHLSFAEPKTAASRRTVSLPAFLRNMLNEHLAGMADASEDMLVFQGKVGGP